VRTRSENAFLYSALIFTADNNVVNLFLRYSLFLRKNLLTFLPLICESSHVMRILLFFDEKKRRLEQYMHHRIVLYYNSFL